MWLSQPVSTPPPQGPSSPPPTVRNLMTPSLSPHLTVTFHLPEFSLHFLPVPLVSKHVPSPFLFHDGNAATVPVSLVSAVANVRALGKPERGGTSRQPRGSLLWNAPRVAAAATISRRPGNTFEGERLSQPGCLRAVHEDARLTREQPSRK